MRKSINKKFFIVISAAAVFAVLITVLLILINRKYLIFTVTADFEGEPVTVTNRVTAECRYDGHMTGEIKSHCDSIINKDGFKVTELYKIDSPSSHFYGATFNVDGTDVGMGFWFDNKKRLTESWVANITLHFYYDENGVLQTDISCDNGEIVMIDYGYRESKKIYNVTIEK